MSKDFISREEFAEFVDTLDEALSQQFKLFEERVDTSEFLLSQLAVNHAEIIASMEAVITELMANRSDEEKREFQKLMAENHKMMLTKMNEAQREVARRDETGTSASVVNMAAEQFAERTGQQQDSPPSGEQ